MEVRSMREKRLNPSPSSSPVRVGILGYGYWGDKLARNFGSMDSCSISMIADIDQARLDGALRQKYGARATVNPSELIESECVDAVIIATPASTHYALARQALLAGKHVLVEKPIARTGEEARELQVLAKSQERILQVDHTFIYSGAVRRIRGLMNEGMFGHLYYHDSCRANFGAFRNDVNVLWDLAPHDLAILHFLIDEAPIAVRASAHSHVFGRQKEMCSLALEFPNSFHAHIRVSWLSPIKQRLTVLAGSKGIVVYDDNEATYKVRVYRKSVCMSATEGNEPRLSLDPSKDTLEEWETDRRESLAVAAEHFIDCISCGRVPVTDGSQAAAVMRVLEAAEHSSSADGETVRLHDDKAFKDAWEDRSSMIGWN